HLFDWIADVAQPSPALWWRTHGGGLRCIFAACDPFDADELAAICTVSLLTGRQNPCRHGITGIEVKAETRHPGYARADGACCGEVRRSSNGADMALACNVLLGREADMDPGQIDEWLAEQGLEYGRAYEHNHCPIDPA